MFVAVPASALCVHTHGLLLCWCEGQPAAPLFVQRCNVCVAPQTQTPRRYDKNGRNKYGFDQWGYTASGFDISGFDHKGYNKEGNGRWALYTCKATKCSQANSSASSSSAQLAEEVSSLNLRAAGPLCASHA